MSQTKAFTNSARRMLIVPDAGSGSGDALIPVPTTRLDERPDTKDDSWYSSSDVVDGTPYENGAVVAQAMGYDCECVMEKDADVTTEMAEGLAVIVACQDTIGDSVRKTVVIVAPDGSAKQVDVDIMGVSTMSDTLEKAARVKWTMKRRGAPTEYTGELT